MKNDSSRLATLVLEDGTLFSGKSYGFHPPHVSQLSTDQCICAELVFNTAMTGYVEILSDPSYIQQIVLLTSAHVGNYGVDALWSERLFEQNIDEIITSEALIVHNLYSGPIPQGRMPLDEFMKINKKMLIADVDTRAVTRHIRSEGSQQATVIGGSPEEIEGKIADILTIIKHSQHITGSPVAEQAGIKRKETITPKYPVQTPARQENPSSKDKKKAAPATSGKKKKLILLDLGAKRSLLQLFKEFDCIALPSTMGAEDILEELPDAVLVSNGPGDPASLKKSIELIQELIGKTVLFGICLGHQLLSLALGAKTYKLPFGHHGANHAVKDLRTNRVFVVSENHGFAVDSSTLPKDVHPWFTNTSDQTLEGIYSDVYKVYSVQFHPEAGPGPHDARSVLSHFRTVI